MDSQQSEYLAGVQSAIESVIKRPSVLNQEVPTFADSSSKFGDAVSPEETRQENFDPRYNHS